MTRKDLPRIPRWAWAALFGLFAFRLTFGLHVNMVGPDQLQSFLIGLKYHCTGLWPYFGLDVQPPIQLPGALLGLLVGAPYALWSLPEAPFLLLNLLTFSSLSLFAWYCSKRLPDFPAWSLWGWVLTAPWLLSLSTCVHSLSYQVVGSVLFTLGFLETIPSLSLRVVRPALANALMGFGLFWNAQFHMSYPILLPLVAFSAFVQAKAAGKDLLGSAVRGVGCFLGGALVSGIWILPTFLHYGLEGLGNTQDAVRFNPSNFLAFFTILLRYFSLASCEIPRFIGPHTAERLAFLKAVPWAAPFTLVAFVLGLLQTLVLLLSGFRQKHPRKDWKAVKALTFCVFLLIYLSFLFAIKVPAAHAYYLFLPLVMLYSFYAFTPWVHRGWFKPLAGTLLACNLIFHVALASYHRADLSFLSYREKVAQALAAKDYRLIGERRPNTRY